MIKKKIRNRLVRTDDELMIMISEIFELYSTISMNILKSKQHVYSLRFYISIATDIPYSNGFSSLGD
jgi:hypothetical protein